MADGDQAKHSARVYLTEARNRRNNPVNRDFCKTLLRWAANARRRAMPQTEPAATSSAAAQPAQMELFA